MSSLSYFDMQMLRNEIENYKQAEKLQLEEIQEKNCRISSLEASLKEEQGLVAKMKEESKEMQVLRNEIEKYKQAEKLQLEEIDEKNCKISSLEASLKEEQELVAKMKEESKEMQVLRYEIENYKQAEKLQLEEIDEKNSKISSLEASLKEEQELVAKMTEESKDEKMEKMENVLLETKSQLRSAESQNVDLTNKYEAKIRALHKAIKHLENKCATEKTMRDKKEKEVESLVVLKIKNEQEKQELKMKLSKTTEEKNETLKELQKQNEQLQTEIQNNEKYIHRNDFLERRIDELLTLPGEVYCRQQKVKSVEEEKEKLQAELKKCQRQNEEYKAGKRWAIDEKNQLTKKNDELKVRLREKECNNITLRKELKAKVLESESQIKELARQRFTIDRLENCLEVKTKQIIIFENETQESGKKISSQENNIARLKTALSKAENDLELEIKRRENLRSDKVLLSETKFCIENELYTVRDTIKTLQNKIKEKAQELQETNVDLANAKTSYNAVKTELDIIKLQQAEQKKKHEKQLSSANDNLFTVKSKLTQTVEDKEEVEKALTKSKHTVFKLEQVIEELETDIGIQRQKNAVQKKENDDLLQQLKGLYDTLGRTVQVEKKASPEQQRKDGDEQIARKKVRFDLSNVEYFPSKGDNELKEQQKEIRDLKGKKGNKLTTYDSKLKAVHGLLPPISTRAWSKTVDNSKKQSESRSSLNLKSTVTPKAEEEMFHPHSPELTSQSTLRRVYNPATKILKRRLSAKPNHI
ncbi:trichohyalin-like [Astatotilapia calliptera]|uniref:trichohyalin-like n=1 Tax=Astatotilapia calliptera TaxID=8154 RepID=UPI000E3F9672|nr:trichohyalin-like [Astatotilapia calliptera]